MTGTAVRSRAWVAVAAVLQLVIWLVTMPDLWDPAPGEWVVWLSLEAGAAVLIGVAAPERALVGRAVLAGWLLQAVHVAVVTPKDDDHNLWGVGLAVLAFLGVLALGVALLARVATRRVRRRPDG